MNPTLAFQYWLVALAIATAFLSLVLLAQDAKAAPQCDAYDRVTTLLAEQYGEALLGGASLAPPR